MNLFSFTAIPALTSTLSVEHLAYVIGGLALFIYGMSLTSEGLRRVAGGRMRQLLKTLTANRFFGVLAGAGVTVMVQSSSATGVMLVGLVNAGLLTLRNAVAVLLGAGIGTTLTVQIIAFDLSSWALFAVALGVLLLLTRRTRTGGALANLLIGLGLIFFGMGLMKSGMAPLRQADGAAETLRLLGNQPVLMALVAALFTGIVQSSAATVALAMSLAETGLLGPGGAIAVVLGANVGTTTTALLSCIGASRDAWRVATINLLLKLIGAGIVLPFVPWLAGWFQWTAHGVVIENAARDIANMHTVFNVALAAFWLPWVMPVAWLMRRAIPEAGPPGRKLVRFLDLRRTDDPDTALVKAAREIELLGERISKMLNEALHAFETNDPAVLDRLDREDNAVDAVHQVIVGYLHDLSGERLSSSETERQMRLLYLVKDLESIGDVASRDLVHLAEKQIAAGRKFGAAARQQLAAYLREVQDDLRAVVAGIGTESEPSPPLTYTHTSLEMRFREMLRRHFERVQEGVAVAEETEVVYTDTLAAYRTIHHRVIDMAAVMRQEETERYRWRGTADEAGLIEWWRGSRRSHIKPTDD